MVEQLVSEIMTKEILSVNPDQDIKEVASILAEKKIGGLPVLQDDKLVGMVSEDDLIMKDVKIHFPTFIHLLDGFIYLESIKRFEDQFRKMIGAKVRDVMSLDFKSISMESTVTEAATMMVEEGLDRLPVLDENQKLVGIVTKADIVKSIANESA